MDLAENSKTGASHFSVCLYACMESFMYAIMHGCDCDHACMQSCICQCNHARLHICMCASMQAHKYVRDYPCTRRILKVPTMQKRMCMHGCMDGWMDVRACVRTHVGQGRVAREVCRQAGRRVGRRQACTYIQHESCSGMNRKLQDP